MALKNKQKTESTETDGRPTLYLSLRAEIPRSGVWIYQSYDETPMLQSMISSGNYKIKFNCWTEDQEAILIAKLGEVFQKEAEKVKFHNWSFGDHIVHFKIWKKVEDVTEENLQESTSCHFVRRLEDK